MEQIGIAAFTDRGRRLAARIGAGLAGQYRILNYESGLKEWCRSQFESHSAGIIFVGACGIAVRSIAPYLRSKTTDPAVLVIDEAGQFVISLLSGHIGGANHLALQVAELTGACPVITTATDVNGKFAVDVFAKKNHLRIGSMKAAKEISAAILRGESVGLYCSGRIKGKVPPELTVLSDGFGTDGREMPQVQHLILIADKAAGYTGGSGGRIAPPDDTKSSGGNKADSGRSSAVEPAAGRAGVSDGQNGPAKRTVLYLYPRPYVLGIGCRRGRTEEEIACVVEEMLSEAQISMEEICGAASIDLKKDEAGLLDFCRSHGLCFETYPAERLREIPGDFSSSGFVEKTTGVDNVCERSALCLAGENSRLIHRKYAKNGVTAALAVRDWSVRFEE